MLPSSRILLLAGCLLLPRLLPALETAPELSFEREVRPILKKHCFQCHGEGEKLKGGVDLRLRRFMSEESENGAIPVVPGKPEESEMIRLVREGEMPAKGKPLPKA